MSLSKSRTITCIGRPTKKSIFSFFGKNLKYNVVKQVFHFFFITRFEKGKKTLKLN